MRTYIVYLLLTTLLGLTVSASIAQENQNDPKTDREVEKLKNRISDLEGKFQTVESVEKMELAAKLTEAQAILRNADFGKFERELRDSNNKWLWGWTTFFVAIVAIVVTVIGLALSFFVKTLIANEVEKRLNDFQDVINQVTKMQDNVWNLLKVHAISVLGDFSAGHLIELNEHTEQIKALSKEMLLDVFNDRTCDIDLKWLAAEVLIARNYTECIEPLLNFLQDIVKSNDFDRIEIFPFDPQYHIRSLVLPIGNIHTQETYNCLRSFINHLLTENPKNKDSWITWTALSLASISVALNNKDSTAILLKSIPNWDFTTGIVTIEQEALIEMINYFNLLNTPKGLKAILTDGLTDNFPEIEKQCLELLEKHDPNFVKERKDMKENTNTESEETDESKRPE